MSDLGRKGRWGNQVFQYMFLRTYARRFNLQYQCPPWEGQRLFGLNDPLLNGRPLPRYIEQYKTINHPTIKNYQDAWCPQITPESQDVVDHDHHGYCQYHTSYYAPEREFLQGLFVPVPKIQERVKSATEELKKDRATSIGLHLRRGDTGRDIFYFTPNEWYLEWLQNHWGRFDRPRLLIATERPADVEAFSEYSPVTSSSLLSLKANRYSLYNYLPYDLRKPTAQSMDWFPDWYLLTQCNVLVFGESTFSFSAAMMNIGVRECWQSRLSTQTFEQVDPWNAQPLMLEHLDDYPPIPNTRKMTT